MEDEKTVDNNVHGINKNNTVENEFDIIELGFLNELLLKQNKKVYNDIEVYIDLNKYNKR
jgi:hypothetical protein